jgi:hypothetical protein
VERIGSPTATVTIRATANADRSPRPRLERRREQLKTSRKPQKEVGDLPLFSGESKLAS